MTTSETDITILKDYRCKCGKLLFRGHLITGVVEVKCKRCNVPKIFALTTAPNTTNTLHHQNSQPGAASVMTS